MMTDQSNSIVKLLLLIFLISSSQTYSQTQYLHCGMVYSMENKSGQKNVTIVVEGNKITDIQKGFQENDTVEIIDLKEEFIFPGFMDMHIHIEHESSPTRYLERFTKEEADVALNAAKYCKRTLHAGFTTVRDLGGSGVNVSLRDAINLENIEGPRIYTCEKSMATTGGHADPTNGMKQELRGDPGPNDGVINSIDDAYKAVRQRYKNGADVIKITATGGVLSVAKDGQGPQFTIEEIEAVVNAANDYGMVTAAHAHGTEGMRRAVVAGIHSIEHGTYMDEEVMKLMKEKGTWYVPTISAGRFVAERAKKPGYYPAIIIPKALAIGPQIDKTFIKAYKYGVPIAFGTDSGVSFHGDNANEFIYMVEGGMSEYEAIKSATVNASQLLRIDDEFGTISVGKYADIIALSGNPMKDIEEVMNVNFVMKGGKVYKNDQ